MSYNWKVVYRDGDKIRVLRGTVKFMGNFIKIERKNKDVLINEKEVVRIERRNDERKTNRGT